MINDQICKTIQNDMSKETTTTNKCIKVWSETSNKWRYIPNDPDYFRRKYYEYLGPKTCTCCGTVVRTQMCRHNRSKKCSLVRDRIAKAIEQIEIVKTDMLETENDLRIT